MTKHLALKNLYLGQLVVQDEDVDSQVYTIGIIRKLRTPEISNTVYLIWFEGTRNYRDIKHGKWEDYSECYLPTLLQIERSICRGRLASSKDLTGVLSERLTGWPLKVPSRAVLIKMGLEALSHPANAGKVTKYYNKGPE